MATAALSAGPCAEYKDRHFAEVRAFAAGGTRLLWQGCNALADAINISLTAVVLIADLALAASLAATVAGLVG